MQITLVQGLLIALLVFICAIDKHMETFMWFRPLVVAFFTGIILGLSRALGEALAVAMVVGQMKIFPESLLMPASTLTTIIAADMGGAMDGGEYSAALWTMALLLFLISFTFIYIIHRMGNSAAKGDAV